jgi:hypothetical protein
LAAAWEAVEDRLGPASGRLWNNNALLDADLWAPGEVDRAAAVEDLNCVSCDQSACYATSCDDDRVKMQLCSFQQQPPFLRLRGLCRDSFLGRDTST